MDQEAKVKNDKGIKESDGLSILDVLKHAIRTTAVSLTEKDRLGLVSFSDISSIEFELQYMTKDNQNKVIKCLDNIYAEGQTNLWSGIQKGLDVLRNGYLDGSRNASLILLTDGEPNIFPPSGFQ